MSPDKETFDCEFQLMQISSFLSLLLCTTAQCIYALPAGTNKEIVPPQNTDRAMRILEEIKDEIKEELNKISTKLASLDDDAGQISHEECRMKRHSGRAPLCDIPALKHSAELEALRVSLSSREKELRSKLAKLNSIVRE